MSGHIGTHRGTHRGQATFSALLRAQSRGCIFSATPMSGGHIGDRLLFRLSCEHRAGAASSRLPQCPPDSGMCRRFPAPVYAPAKGQATVRRSGYARRSGQGAGGHSPPYGEGGESSRNRTLWPGSVISMTAWPSATASGALRFVCGSSASLRYLAMFFRKMRWPCGP